MDNSEDFQQPKRFSNLTILLLSSGVLLAGYVFVQYEYNLKLINLCQQLDITNFKSFLITKINHLISNQENEVIFTKQELKKYSSDSEQVYLAIIGHVFDVSSGRSHYGKGGGYSFFSGIDGSRAFVTGEFNGDGLVDNIEGLPSAHYLGLWEWLHFYKREYKLVGKLDGYFFDKYGAPTQGMKIFEEGVESGRKAKLSDEQDREKFPECNSSWKPDTGGTVWCSENSGGIKRNWIGFPRRYYQVGKSSYRCACVKEEFLSNPSFKEYNQCPEKASSCKIS